MIADQRRLTALQASLVLAVLATAAHFADNAWNIMTYPEPAWITRTGIATAWAAMTLIGVAGYVTARRGSIRIGAALLYAYAMLAGAGVLHYRYGPMTRFTARMHALIVGEALASAAVIACTTWFWLGSDRTPHTGDTR